MQELTIKFAGDSGDGIQLTGTRFSESAALDGYEVITLPLFPAEIRAPAGTLYGVSEFQARVSRSKVFTPGKDLDVLVAFNPAALRVNHMRVKNQGLIIVNTDAFDALNLKKAAYQANPLEDHSLENYKVIKIPLHSLTKQALADFRLNQKDLVKCKNFVALGMIYQLCDQPLEATNLWLDQQFKEKPVLADANKKALAAGYNFAEINEFMPFNLAPSSEDEAKPKGEYRFINGNTALAFGIASIPQAIGREVCFAGYPITPASSVMHELMQMKGMPLVAVQAEDEIAAAGIAVGASYAGGVGVTATSGPGFSLKSEIINLAVMTELPLIVIDIQRCGPSTGMPTKTEQSDLWQAVWGRHGESPLVVLAPRSPSDCYQIVLEAAHIATRFMIPVIILSDGFLANSSEAWRIPNFDKTSVDRMARENSLPTARNPETLARPWIVPGTPGHAHVLGGLEKNAASGQISYAPEDHAAMVALRAEKLRRIAKELPPEAIEGDPNADHVVVSWGSTYGATREAIHLCKTRGKSLAHIHLRNLHPFSDSLAATLKGFRRIMVCENNSGQLNFMLRAEYLVDSMAVTQINGQPWGSEDLAAALLERMFS